jgi:hypothetical protein
MNAMRFVVCAILIVGLAAPAAAEIMEKSVVSGGGKDVGDGTRTLRCTLGQTAIGFATDTGGNFLKAGFWLAIHTSISAVGEDLPIPFQLKQNYPNPFNPMTVIAFSLPEDSDVQLRVYNLRGEMVRELFSGHEAAGEHTVMWDGTDDRGRGVASGSYYARLESSQGVQTRKMLLAR